MTFKIIESRWFPYGKPPEMRHVLGAIEEVRSSMRTCPFCKSQDNGCATNCYGHDNYVNYSCSCGGNWRYDKVDHMRSQLFKWYGVEVCTT
jgi:hypothetical protein